MLPVATSSSGPLYQKEISCQSKQWRWNLNSTLFISTPKGDVGKMQHDIKLHEIFILLLCVCV